MGKERSHITAPTTGPALPTAHLCTRMGVSALRLRTLYHLPCTPLVTSHVFKNLSLVLYLALILYLASGAYKHCCLQVDKSGESATRSKCRNPTPKCYLYSLSIMYCSLKGEKCHWVHPAEGTAPAPEMPLFPHISSSSALLTLTPADVTLHGSAPFRTKRCCLSPFISHPAVCHLRTPPLFHKWNFQESLPGKSTVN